MKKIILLTTLLCVSPLYSIKNNYQETAYDYCNRQNRERALDYINKCKNIPDDVKEIISTYFNNYNDRTDIIKAINVACLTNKELNKIINELHGNPKGFCDLMEIFAARFSNSIIEKVAKQIGTRVAKNYLETRTQLIKGLKSGNTEKIKQAIHNGANIDTRFWLDTKHHSITPLRYAIMTQQINVIKLLLQAGAKAEKYMIHEKSYSHPFGELTLQEKEINQILEEALKKQQS